MGDDVNVLRAKYSREIDEGRRIEAFTSMAEWNWYVDHVILPTIDEYLERILEGKLPEREDLIVRGMINGLKMVVETTTTFKKNSDKAKEQAKKLEEDIKNGNYGR